MSGYTQAQLDALKAAYARGARTVSYDGQSVTFDTGAEMRQRIQDIERSLNPGRNRVHYPSFDRGT